MGGAKEKVEVRAREFSRRGLSFFFLLLALFGSFLYNPSFQRERAAEARHVCVLDIRRSAHASAAVNPGRSTYDRFRYREGRPRRDLVYSRRARRVAYILANAR